MLREKTVRLTNEISVLTYTGGKFVPVQLPKGKHLLRALYEPGRTEPYAVYLSGFKIDVENAKESGLLDFESGR